MPMVRGAKMAFVRACEGQQGDTTQCLHILRTFPPCRHPALARNRFALACYADVAHRRTLRKRRSAFLRLCRVPIIFPTVLKVFVDVAQRGVAGVGASEA